MIKRFASVEVDLETSQIFRNEKEIECPYDIYKAFQVLMTYEYIRDTYVNDDETLWQIALETRQIMLECDYPIEENEAIEKACNNLNITLWEA